MKVEAAAARLEVSKSTVYGLVAAGRLRHYRIGTGKGAIRIPDDAIGEYLASAEVAATPPPEYPGRRAFKHIIIPKA